MIIRCAWPRRNVVQAVAAGALAAALTACGGTKPATLEPGAQIQVPLFIITGEKIRVDTRDGSYLGRA